MAHTFEKEGELFSASLEQVILGAMIKSPDSARSFYGYGVTPDMFLVVNNRNICQSIIEILDKNIDPDVIAVVEQLQLAKKASDKSLSYIVDLAENGYVSAINIEHYTRMLREKYLRRKYLEGLNKAIEIVKTGIDPKTNLPSEDVFSCVDACLSSLECAADDHKFVSLEEAIKRAVFVLEEKFQGRFDSGLKTGLDAIDKRLGGINGLLVLGGRPGMGKTALVVNMLLQVAKSQRQKPLEQRGCIISFNLEMSNLEIVNRLLAANGRIRQSLIKSGDVLGRDEGGAAEALIASAASLKELDVLLNESPNLNVLEICALIRSVARKQRVSLAIIDYLGLIENIGHASTRAEQISTITRKLKVLTKELGFPVLLVSQLNRDVDGRANKRPVLSDLRDSGAIEQDADYVLFVYRDEYYHKEKSEYPGVAEIITAKGRDCEVGSDFMQFDASCGRFYQSIEGQNQETSEYEFEE